MAPTVTASSTTSSSHVTAASVAVASGEPRTAHCSAVDSPPPLQLHHHHSCSTSSINVAVSTPPPAATAIAAVQSASHHGFSTIATSSPMQPLPGVAASSSGAALSLSAPNLGGSRYGPTACAIAAATAVVSSSTANTVNTAPLDRSGGSSSMEFALVEDMMPPARLVGGGGVAVPGTAVPIMTVRERPNSGSLEHEKEEQEQELQRGGGVSPSPVGRRVPVATDDYRESVGSGGGVGGSGFVGRAGSVMSRRMSRPRRCSSPFNMALHSSTKATIGTTGGLKTEDSGVEMGIVLLQHRTHSATSEDNRSEMFSVSLSPPPPKKADNSNIAHHYHHMHHAKTISNYILPSKPMKYLDKGELDALERKRDCKNAECEYYEDYQYGGYKPIAIGEIMADRYEVIRKLGYGHFSTVWLCQDLKEANTKSYTAVKVVKAAQNFTAVATDEIKFLNSIMAHDVEHPGRQFIIQMLDFFTAESINGKHLCIGFELMGPSLLHLIVQSDYQGICIAAVKSVVKQIALGLTYLHEICKIIHTDIKPENILVKANPTYIREMVDLCERYNELGITMPRDYHCADAWENYLKFHNQQNCRVDETNADDKCSIVRWNSFPNISCLESKNEMHNRTVELKSPMFVNPAIEVKIADLGNGCYVDAPFTSQIQTKQYRALEVLLGAGYSYPADIWSLGCLAFELLTGEYLFNPKNTTNFNSREDHILQIYELFGGIPAYIASRGTRSKSFFDQNGELIVANPAELRIWPTEDVLVEKYKFRRMDAIPLAEIINSMVELDPELRFTASDICKSSFCNSP